MPEAEEFEMSANEVITEEVRIAIEEKTTLIADVITKHNAASYLRGQSPADLGRFFCATAAGIKTSAENEKARKALTATFKQTLLGLTSSMPNNNDIRNAS